MHKLPESSEISLRTRQEALDRDKEPYRGTPHARVCIPGTTNTATAGGRPGTRRVSQSQYLGQGQKVPRSPPLLPPGSPPETLRESLARGACAALSLRPFCPRAFVNCNSDTDSAVLLHLKRERERGRG